MVGGSLREGMGIRAPLAALAYVATWKFGGCFGICTGICGGTELERCTVDEFET